MYYGSKDDRESIRRNKLGFGAAKKSTRHTAPTKALPVILTSYDTIIQDATYLRNIEFEYVVVDEGQRLKNSNTVFSKELRTFSSANKILLTGTPIQNNLTELWSLLNFLMPQMFYNLDHFKAYFAGALQGDKVSTSVVTQIHAILKPFMLRRLKVDVERSLPPKKE